MRNILSFIFIISLTVNAFAATRPKTDDITNSPQRYTLDHTQDASKGLTQFDCSQCSSMKDLLFVAPSKECGTNGCLFYVFKSEGKSFRFKTAMFIRSNAFQFLPTKTNGWNDFLFYQSLGKEDAFVIKNTFDGKKYVGTGKRQMIKTKDFGKYMKPEKVTRVYFDKNLKPYMPKQ